MAQFNNEYEFNDEYEYIRLVRSTSYMLEQYLHPDVMADSGPLGLALNPMYDPRNENIASLDELPLPSWKPTCYLDFMFMWLVEGDGLAHCPTYEAWLLAIIQFADEFTTPSKWNGEGESDNRDTICDFWITPEESEQMGLLNRTKVPGSETQRHHPALDRNVYERLRARRG
ncbi:MAG: hypothetical protein WDA07_10960 [Leucobacter sp.]